MRHSGDQFFPGRGFIFGPSRGPRCDDARIGGAFVRWCDKRHEWLMWYFCRDQKFSKDIAPTLSTGAVALATSKDGVLWKRFDGPLEGKAIMRASTSNPEAFDSVHIGVGDVTQHDGTWHLWYFGGNSEIPASTKDNPVPPFLRFQGFCMRPGLATSSDGIQWTRQPTGLPNGALTDVGDDIYRAFPNCIFDGKHFLCYYTAFSTIDGYWQTRVLASEDCRSWQERGALVWDNEIGTFETGGVITRHIVPNPLRGGRRWLMLYTAVDSRFPAQLRSIAAADSDDAMVWRRISDRPILTIGPQNAWDGGGVASPQLVVQENELRLYYLGWSADSLRGGPYRGIGLAISEGGNPHNFRRVENSG